MIRGMSGLKCHLRDNPAQNRDGWQVCWLRDSIEFLGTLCQRRETVLVLEDEKVFGGPCPCDAGEVCAALFVCMRFCLVLAIVGCA